MDYLNGTVMHEHLLRHSLGMTLFSYSYDWTCLVLFGIRLDKIYFQTFGLLHFGVFLITFHGEAGLTYLGGFYFILINPCFQGSIVSWLLL
jgi:hypothetical protein